MLPEVKITHPKRIAIYVIYDKDGILDGYRKYYLKELRKVVDCIVGVVSGTLTPESRAELEELTDEFFVRKNEGLLAGSWLDGIAYIGWDRLAQYDELLMLNDSFFGPFYPLDELMDAAEKSDADFYGAMKNFEEKSYTTIAGRPLQHGHFRGSICYFYIIKSKLLHSAEFRKYWSAHPEIKESWDSYFYAEIDFCDYVIDAGFKVDTYQGDKLKGYFFDNLTHNMVKLVRDEGIPFARIRPFCTDVKDQSLQINYGQDPRETLEYIDKHTNYDVNLIWDYILRTKNLTHIHDQLQLEYVIPSASLERPFTYNKRIAVILHIYYEDLVERIADYCANFPDQTDFYVTTTTKETQQSIIKAFESRKLHYRCTIRPNVGVAMSTLWVTYADVITQGDYEYVCYFHDKKSPYGQFRVYGDEFATRCCDNLFGTPEIAKNIINLFEANPRMGVVGVPAPYHADYFQVCLRNWAGNYQNTVDLAQKLGLHVDINPNIVPVAPWGDMFWCRAKALKKAVAHGFTYDDFDIEYKPDFTWLHAIERIYSFAAQDSGYFYADVLNSDNARSELINLQYIFNQVNSVLFQNGHYPANYVTMLQILHQYKGLCLPLKLQIKHKIKAHCPKFLWGILKRTYYMLGGK